VRVPGQRLTHEDDDEQAAEDQAERVLPQPPSHQRPSAATTKNQASPATITAR
jgi:hypothetical protein